MSKRIYKLSYFWISLHTSLTLIVKRLYVNQAITVTEYLRECALASAAIDRILGTYDYMN